MRQINLQILAGIELALTRASKEQRKMFVWVDPDGEVHITRQGEYLPNMDLVGYTNKGGSSFQITDECETLNEQNSDNAYGILAG